MSKIDELIQELCPEGVPTFQLSEVASVVRGSSISRVDTTEGTIPVLAGGQKPAYWHNVSNRQGENIVVAGSGAYAGFVSYWDKPIWVSDAFSICGQPGRLLTKFCFYWLKNIQELLHSMKRGSGVPHVYASDVANLQIPLPPLEVQREIIKILDKFTELEAELEVELEARTIQYEELRARVMDFSNGVREHPLKKIIRRSSPSGVPQVSLDSLCSIQIGEFVKKTFQNDEYQYPVFNGGTTATGYYSEFNSPELSVVISARGSIGFVNFLETKFWAGNSCYVLRPLSNNLHPKFLYYSLKTRERELFELRSVGSIPALNLAPVKSLQIPLPSIETQERIVEVLDKFDALVSDIKFGLPAELNARRKQYEYYRNKLLTFKEIDAA